MQEDRIRDNIHMWGNFQNTKIDDLQLTETLVGLYVGCSTALLRNVVR